MNNYKIYAIPHYHFDVEWWQTDSHHAQDAIIIISKAIELLQKYPQFTYVLDQVLSIRPFYNKCKDKQEILKQLIKDKRIEVVGGTFSAADENIPYGESIVRQFLYSKKFFQDVLQADIKVGWMIDEFGHPAQLPQILKKAGLDYFVFSRGIIPYDKDMPLDFYWASPDGSKILTHWLKGHYSGYLPIYKSTSKNIKRFYKETTARIEYEGKYSKNLFFPFGGDFCIPTPHWIEFVNKWNEENKSQIIFSLPTKYFEKIKNQKFNTIEQEFNPLFTGCYESRERVKKLCRLTQNKVLTAEKLNTIAYLLNKEFDYHNKDFDYIWERILENDFHDIICGTGTDKVYLNTIKRYNEALNVIEKNINKATAKIIEEIDTTGLGEPIVVFNPLNWEVEDVVECKMQNGKWKIIDNEGNKVESQAFDDKLYFIAKVPSMGYRVYFKTEKQKTKNKKQKTKNDVNFENKFYKIVIDNGCIKSIYDKETDKEILNPKKYLGCQVVQEEDAGNLWTIMKTGKIFKKNEVIDTEIETDGSIFTQVLIKEKHNKMDVEKRIRIYKTLRRIDFELNIDFFAKDRRVKVLFPLNIKGENYYETPFYIQKRPHGHYPAQNFVDISDKNYGLALINCGNPSYEVHNNCISLGLFRSVSLYSLAYTKYFFQNFFSIMKAVKESVKVTTKGLNITEFPLSKYHGITLREWSTEGGTVCFGSTDLKSHLIAYLRGFKKALCLEHGKHNFRFSLYPHKGSIKDVAVERFAYQFNNPLIPVEAKKHTGRLPNVYSFLSIDKDNIILTTFKKAEKAPGIILRFYETKGKEEKFVLNFLQDIKLAEKVSLTEDKKYKEVKIENNKIIDDISKFEIYTLLLQT